MRAFGTMYYCLLHPDVLGFRGVPSARRNFGTQAPALVCLETNVGQHKKIIEKRFDTTLQPSYFVQLKVNARLFGCATDFLLAKVV
jgi:hypothetical protein